MFDLVAEAEKVFQTPAEKPGPDTKTVELFNKWGVNDYRYWRDAPNPPARQGGHHEE